LGQPLGGDDPDLEKTVVRSRIRERLDAAEDLAQVAEQDAGRPARVPVTAVDLDLGTETVPR
jgi:hypothetical protein